MKLISALAAAAGLAALAACAESPQENAAETIDANTEMQVENLEMMANNADGAMMDGSMENEVDGIEDTGDNAVENIEEAAETNTGY